MRAPHPYWPSVCVCATYMHILVGLALAVLNRYNSCTHSFEVLLHKRAAAWSANKRAIVSTANRQKQQEKKNTHTQLYTCIGMVYVGKRKHAIDQSPARRHTDVTSEPLLLERNYLSHIHTLHGTAQENTTHTLRSRTPVSQ